MKWLIPDKCPVIVDHVACLVNYSLMRVFALMSSFVFLVSFLEGLVSVFASLYIGDEGKAALN